MTLRDQIIRDEDCRLRVYYDPLGVPTIGVGRNLRDKGISQTEADFLLGNDILMAVSHQISVQLGSLNLNGKELLDISYGSVLPLERAII